ncbi:MAG: type II toxin-antitoxin system prevent-host-death family antitoxin [Tepidisphaeraceae bacterium]|jgi:prevent-host-death family protein
MSTVGIYQAKTHFTDLMNRVAAGETITITRRGRPVARIVPCDFPDSGRESREIVEDFRKIREAVAKRGGMRGLSVQKLIREGRRL